MATSDSETVRIRELMKARGHEKWGYVVYRCTYQDDAQWAQFMEILNEWTLKSIAAYESLDMRESLDWSVQEDPELQGASTSEIRRRFRNWIDDGGFKLGDSPRYQQCVMVDQACVKSVMKAPKPDDKYGDLKGEGYVYLVDGAWQEAKYDDGLIPIEGCTRGDVGWMKVAATALCPRMYNVIMNQRWDDEYRRHPKTAYP